MPNTWPIDIIVLNGGGWNDHDSFRMPANANLALVQARDADTVVSIANSKGKEKDGAGVFFTIRAGCAIQVSSFNSTSADRFFLRGPAGAVVEILYQIRP